MKEEKLRIAMLSIHSSPAGELGTKNTGGMSVYISELARELGNRGHLVDIYTRLIDPVSHQVIDLYKNVRLIHLRVGNNGPNKPMSKLTLYSHLADYFQAMETFILHESIQYELIHSHYWLSGVLGSWAQDRWGIPHVITYHTLGAVKNRVGVGEQEPEIRLSTERKLAGVCHRILAPTLKEKENLMQHYHVPPEKIGLVPGGVNLKLFHHLNKTSARKHLGFDMNERILLFVGRFDPLKGIERLLTAMTYLQNRKKFHLVIAGGDGDGAPETQLLKELSRRFNIDDAVTFTGRVEQKDLLQYYSAADVLVLPSYYESFGLVGLEALACGTPVVATRVGAMEQILRDGETGYVVPEASPRSLAKSIRLLVAEPHTISADVIRESIVKFDWSNVVLSLLKEYSIIS